MVRIDADSGALPGPASQKTILEAFKPGNEPTDSIAKYHGIKGNLEYMNDTPLVQEEGLY